MTTDYAEAGKVIEIIKDIPITMLTTRSQTGLASRPLTVIEVSDDGDLWFFTTADSDLAREVEADSEVNAAFSTSRQWVSLSGTGSIVHDAVKKQQLFDSMVEAFSDSDPLDPQTVLLHVQGESAQYWENPGGIFSVAASWVKHKLTGQRAMPGHSGTTEL